MMASRHEQAGSQGAVALTVIGTGSWGVVLAAHVASKGLPVTLLARTGEEAAALAQAGESPRAPGLRFPPSLVVTAEAGALRRASVVLFVVPAQSMRENARAVKHLIRGDAILVSASKGLEIGSLRSMSQVLHEETGVPVERICALSGPNLAKEVAAGKPSSTVVACPDLAAATVVQGLVASPTLRVYTHDDLLGVELAGALKNVVALGAGMCDGLQAGDNAKAALMTRGLAEMARLGKAVGAQPLTFSGLAGLGDLIATCMSPLSRNRTTGERLARGERLEDIQADMRQVAEGVPTTRAARELARRHGVAMPIAALMHEVLFGGMSVAEAGRALMQRDPKRELEGIL
jgi:glycerol-3-phosphate dehydrogenase (NAD(P)+)